MGFVRNQALLPALLALAVFASAVLTVATRWGPAIAPDSAVYVGSARSLLAGEGLVHQATGSPAPSPLTHYPPLFPVLLAAIGVFGIDPLAAARLLNVALLGATVLSVGVALRRAAPHSIAIPALGSFLVLASPVMLAVHAVALSEPLFLFTGFSGLFLLCRHLDTARLDAPRRSLLVAAAGCVALAFLTRYAGASLVATGALSLLWLGRGSRADRLMESALFSGIASGPVALWMVRNWFVSGSPTSREIGFHPLDLHNLRRAADTIEAWFLFENVSGGVLLASILVAAGLVIYRVIRGSARVATLTGVMLAFIAVYTGFLALSISFADAQIPLNRRILSPLFLATLICILSGASSALRSPKRRLYRVPAAAIALYFVLVYGLLGLQWANEYVEHGGKGFGSRGWRESEVLRRIESLPEETSIYTNGADAVYILTGRTARRVPAKIHPGSREPNQDYESSLGEMRRELERRWGVVVWFDRITWRWYLPSEEELVTGLRLRRYEKLSDGAIYGLHRRAPRQP